MQVGVLDLLDALSRNRARISSLSGGTTMSFLEMVTPATLAYLKPMSLRTSSRVGHGDGAVVLHQVADEGGHLVLGEDLVLELVVLPADGALGPGLHPLVAEVLLERSHHGRVEHGPADGGEHAAAVPAEQDGILEADLFLGVGDARVPPRRRTDADGMESFSTSSSLNGSSLERSSFGSSGSSK